MIVTARMTSPASKRDTQPGDELREYTQQYTCQRRRLGDYLELRHHIIGDDNARRIGVAFVGYGDREGNGFPRQRKLHVRQLIDHGISNADLRSSRLGCRWCCCWRRDNCSYGDTRGVAGSARATLG